MEEPASESDVRAVESKLGVRLPTQFRNSLLGFSKHVALEWRVPEGTCGLPEWLTEGRLEWSLSRLVEWQSIKREIAEEAGNYAIRGNLAWALGADSMLGFDVQIEPEPPVVLIEHMVPLVTTPRDEKGRWLARDFDTFIDRWSEVGFVGADRYVIDLVPNPGECIDPARADLAPLRQALGLDP